MTTINSLSGGKTSSYMAVHYPADVELFSLVCNDDPKCGNKDRKLMQIANEKLEKTSSQFGEFIGTPEHPSIIKTMVDLEDMLGREIIWVRGESFDKLIKYKKALPNQNARWCTVLMKLDPIFWYSYLRYDTIGMAIGFRYDELERAERMTTSYKFPYMCNTYGSKRQSWKEIKWRTGHFPLITDRVFRKDVSDYWDKKKIYFPEDSNCQMCFWKNEAQIRKNFDDAPNVLNWAKEKEKETGNRFRHKMNMEQIERLGIQEGFEFGGGAGCQAGYCTD